MGWAKYAEDNLELFYDRQYMKNEPPYNSILKDIIPIPIKESTVGVAKKAEKVIPQDKLLRCHTCGKQFLFSASAQSAYKKKGWETPKRCRCCREANTIRHLMRSEFCG